MTLHAPQQTQAPSQQSQSQSPPPTLPRSSPPKRGTVIIDDDDTTSGSGSEVPVRRSSTGEYGGAPRPDFSECARVCAPAVHRVVACQYRRPTRMCRHRVANMIACPTIRCDGVDWRCCDRMMTGWEKWNTRLMKLRDFKSRWVGHHPNSNTTLKLLRCSKVTRARIPACRVGIETSLPN
jgi:hypothetical protein